MRGLSVILSVLVAISPINAAAEICEDPIAVQSPCEGVLLPPSAAEEGLKCLRVQVPRLELELKYLRDERASFERYHTQMLAAEQKRGAALEKQVEMLLKNNVSPRWYESTAFHFALGFITASVVTIGITHAVNSN